MADASVGGGRNMADANMAAACGAANMAAGLGAKMAARVGPNMAAGGEPEVAANERPGSNMAAGVGPNMAASRGPIMADDNMAATYGGANMAASLGANMAAPEPRPFRCPSCPKRFLSRAGLRRHERRHGPAPIETTPS